MSVGSSASTVPESAGRLRAALPPAAAVVAAGATTTALAREGGYGIGTWAPAGVCVATVAAAGLAAGRRPPRAVAVSAAALLALGAWSVASVAWGGLPDDAWRAFDEAALGSAALVAGSVACRRRGLVVGALLAALTVSCGAVLVSLAATGGPRSWFYGRYLDGPVGYHNAEASLAATGLCLAAGLLAAPSRTLRVSAAAAAEICVAVLLLTQSRGGALAAAAALAAIVLVARDTRLLARLGGVTVGTVLLGWSLRSVDAALVGADPAEAHAALRRFAALTLAATAVAALAAYPDLRPRSFRRAVAVLALGAAVALAALHPPLHDLRTALDEVQRDAPPVARAGDTRFVAMTLNGRLDAWRVALRMVERNPVLGEGVGTFTRRWTIERRHPTLYVVQPHSIELELLSEQGPVALLLFAVFVGSLLAALVRRPDPLRLGAAGAVVAVVAQASVDWTWSFPAIVATALAAAAAAAGRTHTVGRDGIGRVAAPAAALALASALVVPLAAARLQASARASAALDPPAAWSRVSTALALNPWSAAAEETRGRIAEAAGDLGTAARSYERAALLSRHPWLDEYRAARALRRAGRQAAADAACARAVAGNPDEPTLHAGPCSSGSG